MKPKPGFTMENLIEELLACMPGLDEGTAMTTVEMAKATGLSQNAIRARLNHLKESGHIRVARKQITTLNDRVTTVTAWVAVKDQGQREAISGPDTYEQSQ